MEYIIRKKELKDCEDWINVNISSWNDNLKGIVSDKLLENISSNKDERIKKEIKNFKQDDYHYVLEENKKIVGILKIKESERDDFIGYGEVQVLYLLSSAKGKGYGKALINVAFSKLKEKGFNKVVIGCLDGNPSNEFYKHLAGEFIKQENWNIFDECYKENIYLYEI